MDLQNSSRTPVERLNVLSEDDSGKLLRYFQRRLEVQADVPDLVNETFIVLWQRLDRLPADDAQGRMWMFGVARKVLQSHYRGESRRTELSTHLRESLTSVMSENSTDEAMTAVRDAVRNLPDRMREVVILVHWDQFPLVEAAQILDANVATVRSWYRRARRRLQNALADSAHAGSNEGTYRSEGP